MSQTTVPVVSIVGLSGSGKTTLVEKVVAELTRRGLRVGTVKHDAHGFEIDREGKDSWRHKKAGALAVVLASSEKLAVIRDTGEEWPPARLVETFLTHVDVVVAEGFKESGFPKIEVVRRERSAEAVRKGDPLLLAVATDVEGLDAGAPRVDIDDFSSVCDLIEKDVIGGHRPAEVSLVADGTPVELNDFARNVISGAITGMARTLKGCEDARELEIRVKRK